MLFIVLCCCSLSLVGCQGHQQDVSHKQMSSWHTGVPSVLKHRHTWESNPTYKKMNGKPIYMRQLTDLGQHEGCSIIAINYSINGVPLSNSNDSASNLPMNPHYQRIGKNTYHVISGMHTLKGELKATKHPNNMRYLPVSSVEIKILNPNLIQIWQYHKKHNKVLDSYQKSDEDATQIAKHEPRLRK